MKIYVAQLLAGVAMVGVMAGSAQAQGKDIVDTAVAAGQFKTLAAALQAAGLVETLKGKGPFTCSHRPTRRSPSCPPARSKCC